MLALELDVRQPLDQHVSFRRIGVAPQPVPGGPPVNTARWTSKARLNAGRGGDHLDLMVPFEVFQSVPQANAAAEQDRDHHDVHVVDQPGGEEPADRRRATASALARPAMASISVIGIEAVMPVVVAAPSSATCTPGCEREPSCRWRRPPGDLYAFYPPHRTGPCSQSYPSGN